MMISSNGPGLHETAKVKKLMGVAYEVWTNMAKRMPSRSHPGVEKPRKKKIDSTPVHELLCATSSQVAREERTGGHIEVSDPEDERNDEGEYGDEDDTAAPR